MAWADGGLVADLDGKPEGDTSTATPPRPAAAGLTQHDRNGHLPLCR